MPTYRLTVKAQDSGLSNSMPIYANVVIYLNDVNDNKPQLNLTLPSHSSDEQQRDNTADAEAKALLLKSGQIHVSELTPTNSFLAQLSVHDADSGINGHVQLELKQHRIKTGHHHRNALEESSDFALIHLFNNIYSLMTKRSLDREDYDKYLLEVVAHDHGQPVPLQTTLRLEIVVGDENDNVPVFAENVYEFELMEIATDKHGYLKNYLLKKMQ